MVFGRSEAVAAFSAAILIALSSPAFADASSIPGGALERVARSEQWLRLLHYDHRWLGGIRSRADGPAFFLAENGATDPLAELRADVEAFSRPEGERTIGPYRLHAQCAFPERYRYLKSALGLVIPDTSCPDFTEWKRKLDVEGASLVFSSAYPNNPASMFGHTLLKLRSRGSQARDGGESPELLDYGVSFAADAEPSGIGLQYVFLGLTGGYQGYFALSPYFTKVTEYSNQESRDLWEYRLNLSPEQLERLVNHLWELRSTTWFDYYFIDENCSYYLMRLLDVASPEWDLTRRFGGYVLPADTIRAVQSIPGAVTEVKLRPSHRRRLFAQLDALAPGERRDFEALKDDAPPERIGTVAALDAYISYLNFRRFKDPLGTPDEERVRLRKALLARSRLGAGERPAKPSESGANAGSSNRADLGHLTSAWALLGGSRAGKLAVSARARWGLHDFLDGDAGYEPLNEMVFVQAEAQYLPERGSFRLDSLRVFEVSSLFPYEPLDRRLSWSVRARFDSLRYLTCDTCRGAVLEARGGLTFQGARSLAIYALGSFGVDASGALPKSFLPGPGGVAGLIASPVPELKLRLEASSRFDLLSSFGPGRRWVHAIEAGAGWTMDSRWQLRGEALLAPRVDGGTNEAFRSFQAGVQRFF